MLDLYDKHEVDYIDAPLVNEAQFNLAESIEDDSMDVEDRGECL